MLNHRLFLAAVLAGSTLLAACNPSEQDGQPKYDVKPAVKLTPDASRIARDSYAYLVQVEPVLNQQPVQTGQFDQQVFQPVRQLLLRWGTEVKQGDSVVGDQYTICRGALISLDSWARSVQKQSATQADKLAVFNSQKALCGKAVQQSTPQP